MSSVHTIKPVKAAAKPAQAAAPAQAIAPAVEAEPASKPPKSAADVAREMRAKRARKLLQSLLLWVGIPTLLGLVYYGAIAQDEYQSVTTLMVQGPGREVDEAGVLLREYVLSRDMLAVLDSQEGFSSHYREQGGWLSRLSPDAGSEARYQAYRGRVSARAGESGVFKLSVRAFSAPDAQRFASRMVSQARAFLASAQPSAKLVIIAQPSAPTDATYPERLYGVLTVFLVALALFAIGSLLIAAVREHAQF